MHLVAVALSLLSVGFPLPGAAHPNGPGSTRCGLVDGAVDGSTDDNGDSVPNCRDNCPLRSNEDQSDLDGDGIGDLCDCDLNIDTTDYGEDGECDVDCTLHEAVALAPDGCALSIPAGVFDGPTLYVERSGR